MPPGPSATFLRLDIGGALQPGPITIVFLFLVVDLFDPTGAPIGTSTTTRSIESTAGINAGGRTGLTAVMVAVPFLLALFFAPLAQTLPACATAPALLSVFKFALLNATSANYYQDHSW